LLWPFWVVSGDIPWSSTRMTNQTIFFVLPDDETQQYHLKISDGQIHAV
jgi:hypothetical protein